MYTNANAPAKTISDDEREAFLKAMILYYSEGLLIADAFDQVEPGLVDRYYRRRKLYPEEIEEINREALAVAQKEVSGEQLALAARQMRESRELQMAAIEATKEALTKLGRIVNCEPFTVEGKVIIPYPRDIIAAANVILEIARKGVMPATYPRRLREFLEADKRQEPERTKPFIPVLGVNPKFSKITATAADGTEFTAEVKRTAEVIEGEIEEIGD